MSQDFVRRISEGFQGGHHRLELHDHVAVFCASGLKVEGELMGLCPEGLLLGCERTDVWVNPDAVAAVARVRRRGGDDGPGREECVPPDPSGLQQPVVDGNETMSKMFCNGTR